MSAPLKASPGILIKSPYSVKVEAMNPMEYMKQEDPDVQVVKGNLYLQTDDEEDLSPEVKAAFKKDIKYNVQSVLSSSRDYLEVNISHEVIKEYPVYCVYLMKYMYPGKGGVGGLPY